MIPTRSRRYGGTVLARSQFMVRVGLRSRGRQIRPLAERDPMMRRNIRQFGAGLLCMGLWAVLATGGASAQSADPPAQVGRLSEVDGTVSFHTADQAQWSQAVINYPVP